MVVEIPESTIARVIGKGGQNLKQIEEVRGPYPNSAQGADCWLNPCLGKGGGGTYGGRAVG